MDVFAFIVLLKGQTAVFGVLAGGELALAIGRQVAALQREAGEREAALHNVHRVLKSESAHMGARALKAVLDGEQ